MVLAQASSSVTAVNCSSPPPPPLDSRARATLRVVREGFDSLGHAGGQFRARLLANDAALRPGAEPGAIWVEELVRTSDEARGPILAMERRASEREPGRTEWCFLVADHDGVMLRTGALEDCAGCHAAAPAGVFSASP
jgi:hypothetical protein